MERSNHASAYDKRKPVAIEPTEMIPGLHACIGGDPLLVYVALHCFGGDPFA